MNTCNNNIVLERQQRRRVLVTPFSSSPIHVVIRFALHLLLILSLLSGPCLGFSAKIINGGGDDIGLSNAAVAAASNPNNRQLQIAFVTGNAMKAKELSMILDECTHGNEDEDCSALPLVNLRVINVDLPEIQEVNTEAIAKEKALLGAQLAGGPCVVEDTSLQFTALGGMPGPYIKWFQDRLGNQGLYDILTAYQDKSAQAVCTLAFCPYPHADPVLFTGITHGTIVQPVEGRGFGWDAIFVPTSTASASSNAIASDEEPRPYSLMTTEEKNRTSHRGKAVRKWAAWLKRNQQELWERQRGRPAIGHKGLDFKCTSVEE